MNALPSTSDRRDPDGWTHTVLVCFVALLGGFAAGLIFSSLGLTLWLAGRSEYGPRVALIDALGSFVGGHLQALGLLAVAFGLYLQSRQLSGEREARGQELAAQKDAQRREMFHMLLERHEHYCGQMSSVIFAEDSTDRPAREVALSGVSGVVRAIDEFDLGLGNTVRMEWAPLREFVNRVDQLTRIASVITDAELRDQLLANIDSENAMTIKQAIVWRESLISGLRKQAQALAIDRDRLQVLEKIFLQSHLIECVEVEGQVTVRVWYADGTLPKHHHGKSLREAYVCMIDGFFNRVMTDGASNDE